MAKKHGKSLQYSLLRPGSGYGASDLPVSGYGVIK
jgi:hypothetical protein